VKKWKGPLGKKAVEILMNLNSSSTITKKPKRGGNYIRFIMTTILIVYSTIIFILIVYFYMVLRVTKIFSMGQT